MQIDNDLRQIIEAEQRVAPGWFPVCVLMVPVPLDVYALTTQAIDAALSSRGYLSAFRVATGLTVVWARPRQAAELIDPPGQPPLIEAEI